MITEQEAGKRDVEAAQYIVELRFLQRNRTNRRYICISKIALSRICKSLAIDLAD